MSESLRLEKVKCDGHRRDATGAEIGKMLDSGLPEKYTTELFEQKCGVLFQHVLEKYPESGESVYGAGVA